VMRLSARTAYGKSSRYRNSQWKRQACAYLKESILHTSVKRAFKVEARASIYSHWVWQAPMLARLGCRGPPHGAPGRRICARICSCSCSTYARAAHTFLLLRHLREETLNAKFTLSRISCICS
jgi:hypothetical protein